MSAESVRPVKYARDWGARSARTTAWECMRLIRETHKSMSAWARNWSLTTAAAAAAAAAASAKPRGVLTMNDEQRCRRVQPLHHH